MNAIQGHAYRGMVGLHMCVPEIFGIIAFSWLLRRLIRLNSCSSNDETALYIGLEVFLRLRFVNDLAYGVWIVPSFPGKLQQGVGSSREETPGCRLLFLCDWTCQLIYPHKFEVCKCAPSKNFTSHLYCLTSKVNLVAADPNLRGYTNYLPVTRETTKLVSSDQMRSSHCSWMIWSL